MSPMVRRAFAVGLALLFLLAAGSPVSAAELSERSIITIGFPGPWEPTPHPGPFLSEMDALSIFQRSAQLELDQSRLHMYLNEWGPTPTWEFTYHSSQGRIMQPHDIGSIHAQTGKLIRLDLSAPQMLPLKTGPMQNPYPEEFARVWARAKVRELLPEAFPTLREAPADLLVEMSPLQPYSPATYTFTWMQYIDDLPILHTGVTVGLDKETLRCVYFYATLYDGPVNQTEPALPAAEALDIFRGYGLELTYVGPYGEPWTRSTSYRPVWRAPQAMATVDPMTGEMTNEWGMPLTRTSVAVPIPANETIALRPGPLPLTRDQALLFASQVLETPPDAKLQFERGPEGETSYGIYWNNDTGHFSLYLDADTGLITGAYRSRFVMYEREPFAPVEPTEEQITAARLAAITTVQRLYHAQIHNLRGAQSQPYSPFEFFFQRYVNGIPVQDEGVYVSIDPVTLQWTSVYAHWNQEATFPSPNPALTKAEAEQIFYANRTAMLVYAPPSLFMSFFGGRYGTEAIRPAYVLTSLPAAGVDGATGELLDYAFQPLYGQERIRAAIAGHWAEQELWFAFGRQALNQHTPNPATPLNRIDAIRLLLTEFDYWNYPMDEREVPYVDVPTGSPAYWFVQTALANGWIVPQGSNPRFNGNEPISRAEFAMMVARHLQLGALASSTLRIQTDYADLGHLPQEQRNAIAFLEALGIVRSAPTFRPSDALTQAEAAVILVRLLNRAWGWQHPQGGEGARDFTDHRAQQNAEAGDSDRR